MSYFDLDQTMYNVDFVRELYNIIIPPYANKLNCAILLVKNKETG